MCRVPSVQTLYGIFSLVKNRTSSVLVSSGNIPELWHAFAIKNLMMNDTKAEKKTHESCGIFIFEYIFSFFVGQRKPFMHKIFFYEKNRRKTN